MFVCRLFSVDIVLQSGSTTCSKCRANAPAFACSRGMLSVLIYFHVFFLLLAGISSDFVRMEVCLSDKLGQHSAATTATGGEGDGNDQVFSYPFGGEV
jgi:hypothetical protein